MSRNKVKPREFPDNIDLLRGLVRPESRRKVKVRVFGQQQILLCGDIVLDVPAEMTDKEVAERIPHADDLPWPDEWQEFGEPQDIEIPDDVPAAIVGKVGAGRKADARLVVNEDGDQEIVS